MWVKLVCLALFAAVISADTGPPNIIWIFGDDMGYDDIGLRSDEAITPNLDALAEEGVMMTNHYVQHICTPSRASFLTGRYPMHMGLQHSVILPFHHFCMPLKERTLPQYLKDLGYSTHAYGKWHLGVCRWECTPMFRGFDTFSGGYNGGGDYYKHLSSGRFDWNDGLHLNYSTIGEHSTDIIVNRAFETIDNNDGEPMFMYLAFHNPHSPYQPKPEHLEKFADYEAPEHHHEKRGGGGVIGHESHRKEYLALLFGLDEAVGKLVQKLKDAGKYDNSIIVFASDNGPDPHEGISKPFRGGKGSLFEGGTKSLTFAVSPLFEKTAYENNGLMHVSDWLPTLLSIASNGEMTLPDDLDGIDQSDMLLNGGPSKRKNMIYNIDRDTHYFGGARSGEIGVRNEKYKLLWGMTGNTDGYGHGLGYAAQMQKFYDFVNEHSETTKRGGPYRFSAEDTENLAKYMDIVKVTDEDLEEGTGFIQLYNLEEDPSESNNLADSDDEADQEAKEELIQMVRDALKNYVPVHEGWGLNSPELVPKDRWTPGWCNCEELPEPRPVDYV